jgi:hypothetical protein
MLHRGIATVAIALMLCYFLLTRYDSQFFLFHFYESLIYIVILLMLFYFEEKWAYMLGIFAPAAWLIITFVSGGTISALRQLRLLITGHSPEDAAAFISLLACLLSVLMIIVCAYRWKLEYAGLGKGMKTALISLLVTVVYYGIMIVWFWHAFPHSSATG